MLVQRTGRGFAPSSPRDVDSLRSNSSTHNSAERTIALKEVAFQLLDSTCKRMTKDESLALYARWEVHLGKGKRDPPGEGPTEDRLSALKFIKCLTGSGKSLVEFCIWGLHGVRIPRTETLIVLVFNDEVQLVHVELTGPVNFALWLACSNVLGDAFMIPIDAVDVGTVDKCRNADRRVSCQAWRSWLRSSVSS